MPRKISDLTAVMLTEQRLGYIYDELKQDLQELTHRRDHDEKVVKHIALVTKCMQEIHKLRQALNKCLV